MSNVKNYRLGLLGLCVAAGLALMAIGASGAQAAGCTATEPTLKPCWMIGGSNVTANKTVTLTGAPEEIEVPGDGKQKVALLLAETALHAPIWIACSSITTTTSITVEKEGKATGKLRFNTCSTYLKSGTEMKLSAICAPTQPIDAGGTLEIALHEGVPVAKGTGETAGVFVKIVFPKKTSCALEGEEYAVSGTAWLEDVNGFFTEEKATHLVKEDTAAAAKLGGLKFGANPASIDGKATISLFESGLAKEFSGLAG